MTNKFPMFCDNNCGHKLFEDQVFYWWGGPDANMPLCRQCFIDVTDSLETHISEDESDADNY